MDYRRHFPFVIHSIVRRNSKSTLDKAQVSPHLCVFMDIPIIIFYIYLIRQVQHIPEAFSPRSGTNNYIVTFNIAFLCFNGSYRIFICFKPGNLDPCKYSHAFSFRLIRQTVKGLCVVGIPAFFFM